MSLGRICSRASADAAATVALQLVWHQRQARLFEDHLVSRCLGRCKSISQRRVLLSCVVFLEEANVEKLYQLTQGQPDAPSASAKLSLSSR